MKVENTYLEYTALIFKIKIMQKFIIVLGLLTSSICFAQKPLSDPNGAWALMPDYSDEFNAPTVDLTKWDIDVNDWGVWSWEPQHVYLANGKMRIRMVNEQHVRGGETYYFKSGAARQKKEITYGYFESSVKGCPKWPGVCPAFWMYSVNQPVTNGVKYNEIDFMEIQQRQFNIKTIDCNLHLERIIDGKVVRTLHPTVYNAPFAPNDGYHVYGCDVTPSKITFYIDGVEVGTQVNDYFILPMRVILSMGLRPPLMKYLSDGSREPIAILNEPGFPTEMEVDYVRVWQKTIATSNSLDKSVPLVNQLYQNFPNPVNNKTTIKYDLGVRAKVKLSIYNLAGTQLEVIVDKIENEGTHLKEIDISNFEISGTYFYKLQIGNQILTKKLILVK